MPLCATRPPPRIPCPHNLPWIPNRFEPGGYNCSADLCYLDPFGDLYFRDSSLPQSRRSVQREALLEMQNRDAMRRAARQFAGSVDRGADVLFRSNSGEKFRSHLVRREENDRRSSTRPSLVVPRAEREETYESQSLLKKLFTKKPTSELPERRHTGIEPDGAWSLPYSSKTSSRHEKPASKHESVRREPSKREPSRHESVKQPSSSKVPSSTSRYPSIAGPPTRTPTVATKASSKSKASTSSAPHEKEIEKWEERKKAAEKGVGKSGKTVKTVGYKLGNMARTIVEGQR
jgi:hypothetical protein